MSEPEIALQMTEAELEPESMLGDAPARLSSRVLIGMGIGKPIAVDQVSDDQDLRESLELLAEADFYRVRLSCTLHEMEGETIHGATFYVRLASESGGSATAWSLLPDKLYEKSHDIVDVWKASEEVKGGLPISVTAGLRLEQSHSDHHEHADWWLSGTGESTSEVCWRFRRLPEADLNDDHPLWLVARITKGETLRVTCSLDAKVSRGALGTLVARARSVSNRFADPYEFELNHG